MANSSPTDMHFYPVDPTQTRARIKTRPYETKLGERIRLDGVLHENTPRFVLLGIREDLGARANMGLGGAASAWDGFLDAFLNIQDNPFLRGADIQLLGHFDFTALDTAHDSSALRDLVALMDDEIAPLIARIVASGRIPLILGGSHASAYPNLKGCAEAGRATQLARQVNCINLDAHSDYRPMEGRHSGNGFRYAHEQGYLQRYAIIGLHENYTPDQVWQDLSHSDIQFSTWEDIFLREKISFAQALDRAINFVQTPGAVVGIELDLDCIERVLSSAVTPSGVSTQQARYYAYQTGLRCNAAYLHLCEGAIKLENGLEDPSTGKLLSYLLSDFVKGVLDRS
jgi:formiminoglutamase